MNKRFADFIDTFNFEFGAVAPASDVYDPLKGFQGRFVSGLQIATLPPDILIQQIRKSLPQGAILARELLSFIDRDGLQAVFAHTDWPVDPKSVFETFSV